MKGKYRIYATDINDEILKKPKNGIFPLSEIQRAIPRIIKNQEASDLLPIIIPQDMTRPSLCHSLGTT